MIIIAEAAIGGLSWVSWGSGGMEKSRLKLEPIPGAVEASKTRRFEVRDIAKRLGVISPERLFINGFPVSRPIAAFNASFRLEGDKVILYPRIIVGYYKYVSAIVETVIPVSDILSGQVNLDYYSSSLAITPSTEYDLWGAEDPRAYTLKGLPAITYTGRTISYFEKGGTDRTLPITALRRNGKWVKWIIHRPSSKLEGQITNDKNAFILEDSGQFYFMHRPQDRNEEYYLVIGRIDEPPSLDQELVEVRTLEDKLALPHAEFEEKVGWGAPPIEVRPHEYLILLHGVGRKLQAYRVFALLLSTKAGEPELLSVTPYYVMEPREPYEVYGDRPYTVFPCGAARIDDEILVSYGAADYMIGFATISYSELLMILDKNRVG